MTDPSSSVTPELEQLAETRQAGDLVDVVIELQEDASKAASVEEARESFGRVKEPVGRTITELGGSVMDEAWINRTLRARLPVDAVTQISQLDSVRAVDVPHGLEAD